MASPQNNPIAELSNFAIKNRRFLEFYSPSSSDCARLVHVAPPHVVQADHKKGAPPLSHHLVRAPPTSFTTRRLSSFSAQSQPIYRQTNRHARTHLSTHHTEGKKRRSVVARAGCGSGSLESIDAAGAAASFATQH